ncbi:hypothetical protein CHCC20327_2415 [Bacillus licheniformis]|nr:hypothetical protein CHCC20327_2415 [Bacillus licheniformis]
MGHRRLQGRKPIQTIHAALDQEINLVNTAPAYGFGTDRAKIHGSADKRKSQETGEENSPVFFVKNHFLVPGNKKNCYNNKGKPHTTTSIKEVPYV